MSYVFSWWHRQSASHGEVPTTRPEDVVINFMQMLSRIHWHMVGECMWQGWAYICRAQVPAPIETELVQVWKYRVINLRSSVDRLTKFNRLAVAAGMPEIERFDAIDKETMDVEALMASGVICQDVWKQWNKWSKPGDLACMVSHLSLWRWVANEEDNVTVMVFEDDALIPRDFQERLDEALPSLCPDWDYHLGYKIFPALPQLAF